MRPAGTGLFPTWVTWFENRSGLISNLLCSGMPHLEDCRCILRRLIAKGDAKNLHLAERAVNVYWDSTPQKAQVSGLRLLQLDVLEQRNAVVGAQHDVAQAVNDYIEQKLRGE